MCAKLPLFFWAMPNHYLFHEFIESTGIFQLNFCTTLVEILQLPHHAVVALEALVKTSQLLVQLMPYIYKHNRMWQTTCSLSCQLHLTFFHCHNGLGWFTQSQAVVINGGTVWTLGGESSALMSKHFSTDAEMFGPIKLVPKCLSAIRSGPKCPVHRVTSPTPIFNNSPHKNKNIGSSKEEIHRGRERGPKKEWPLTRSIRTSSLSSSAIKITACDIRYAAVMTVSKHQATG